MDITVQELKQRLEAKDKFTLIDVREPHEHAAFNLGGELVPLGTIPDAIERLQDDKNGEIVVYCRSGARSGGAQSFLQSQGFTNVRNLTGGVLAWVEAFPK